ncbi:MAG: PAS domain S-box protein [Nanoarchaeota archaeon]
MGDGSLESTVLALTDRVEHLEQTVSTFTSIADHAADIVWLADKDLKFTYVNPSIERILGYPYQDFLGKHITTGMTEISREIADRKNAAAMQRVKNGNDDSIELQLLELEYVHKDGHIVYMENQSYYVYDREGKFMGLAGITRDITPRILAQKERQKLEREFTHRIMNYLQVILSSLVTIRVNTDDEKTKETLRLVEYRVDAIYLIQRAIEKNDLSRINFTRYAGQMISNLQQKICPGKNITTEIEGEAVYLSTDNALAAGLVLNELVVNAFQYAFTDKGDKGRLYVEIKRSENNCTLIVGDDGKGIPLELFDNPRTPGLSDVMGLVKKQLGGNIELDRSHGTKYTISFIDGTYAQRT